MISKVLAQDTINILPTNQFNQIGGFTIPGIISAIIQMFLIIAALIFFFMLVFGGIQWMTSGGDKAATEAARGRITAALIGLVIIFAAWAIIALIARFFGINLFQFNIPTIPSGGS